MKKLWILFTALALLAVAMPAVAVDVTSGAVFYWHGIAGMGDDPGAAAVNKARIKLSGVVDEYNTISTELRWNNGGNTWDPAAVKIKTFKLATDITGALGLDLPVTIKSTVGVWESDFTAWWYATRAGWFFAGGFNEDEQKYGAAQLDIGVGPANIHLYQNFLNTTMLGADAAFGPVGAWVAFKGPSDSLGDGALAVELKYEGKFGDLALSAYPALKYDLEASQLGWDFGVKVGYKMLTVAASAGGTDPDFFDKIEAEVGAAFGAAELWVAGYMSLAATDPFQGLDIMASYKLGAATVYAGYMFCPDTTTVAVPVDGAEWDSTTGGLYLGVKCSF
jgi:hypothetical protein